MTPEEKTQLKDYSVICGSLNGHRFFKETEELTLKLNKQSRSHSLHGYDEDLFKSFLLDFRKIVMKDEPTFFHKVANIISRRNIKLRPKVGGIKKRYEDKLKSSPLLLESPSKRLDIVDAWLNGQYFHQDKDLRSALQEEIALKKHHFIATVIDLTAIAMELAEVSKNALGGKKLTSQKNTSPSKQDIEKVFGYVRGQEFVSILKKLSVIPDNGKVELTNYEQIRLFLYAAGALYGKQLLAETLDNHELHIAYTYREKINPFFEESWLIFKTLVSDTWDQKAGWYWFPHLTKKSILNYATKYLAYTDDENVRYGVLSLLEEFWSPEYYSFLEKYAKDEASSLRKKTLEILKVHKNKQALPILEILIEDKEEHIRKAAFELRANLLIKFDNRKALALLKETKKLDDYHIADLGLLLKKLNRQELEELTLLEAESLRIFAFRELIERVLKVEEIEVFLTHKQWEVRYFAIQELLARGKELLPSRIEELLKIDKHDKVFSKYAYDLSDLDKTDILKGVYESKEPLDLEKSIDWTTGDSQLIYEIIGKKDFNRYKDEIRNDLKNRFTEKRKVWQERSAARFKISVEDLKKTFDQYEELITTQFCVAALKIIYEHGGPKDVPMARALYAADSYELKRLCVAIIKKYGNAKDSLFLLDISRSGRLYDDRPIMGALSLDKAGKNKILTYALESENETHVKRAIAFAYKNSKVIPPKKIDELLRHQNDGTRAAAVAYVCERYSEKQMEKLLNEYVSKGHYFYNVVCWLDRILHAPPVLKKIYHRELKEKLAWKEEELDLGPRHQFFRRQLKFRNTR